MWGLSFKPNTDDIRNAPSVEVIHELLDAGARVVVYDPVAVKHVQKIFGQKIKYADSAEEMLEKVHGLVVMTEWEEFTKMPASKLRGVFDKVVFDGRNCMNAAELSAAGITLVGMGKGSGNSAMEPPVYLRGLEFEID